MAPEQSGATDGKTGEMRKRKSHGSRQVLQDTSCTRCTTARYCNLQCNVATQMVPPPNVRGRARSFVAALAFGIEGGAAAGLCNWALLDKRLSCSFVFSAAGDQHLVQEREVVLKCPHTKTRCSMQWATKARIGLAVLRSAT